MDKSSQKIGSHSSGVQAGRDVHVHNYGLAVNEVRELSYLFLKENFPKLREEALKEARTNVEAFLEQFNDAIRSRIDKIEIDKFKTPDIQASLNEAVKSAAKKGRNANFETLSNLIIERTSKESSPFLSIVADEAINIVPKLLKDHINFLSFTHFLKSMQINDAKSLSDIENYAKSIIEAIGDPKVLNTPNKLHLQYAGCINILEIIPLRPHDFISKNYSFLSGLKEAEIDKKIKEESPFFNKIWIAGIQSDLQRVVLTSVGQIIALTNLKKGIPGNIDFSIWIR